MRTQEFAVDVGGKRLVATFSDLADQADGAVTLRSGNTVVLVTAVMAHSGRDPGYFPLTVDYVERFYAVGRIPGSRYARREGKPSDEAVLSARLVDRAIRPLFDQEMRNDVHVVITVLSVGDDDPDTLAVTAASLALLVSDIPWNGPVSAVRIGRNARGALVNPAFAERRELSSEILACGKKGLLNMVEAAAREMPEADIAEDFGAALDEIARVEEFQLNIAQRIGKLKRAVPLPETPAELSRLFAEAVLPKLDGAVFSGTGKTGIHELEREWLNAASALPGARNAAERLFARATRDAIRRGAVSGRRADGRAADEVRPLFAQAGGVSPVLHGSGIFYRGGTHVLSVLTLGSPAESLAVDDIEESGEKRFMHHYNFPPFSAGETGRIGSPNRRMVGHGALVEKALAPVIPDEADFPYAIRVVSECMASNGSTSMASVCAASLALMDGGVPVRRAVAGVAMGLASADGKSVILTDIQGPEDEYGDMDFKIAGTSAGVTALQLDVKVEGVPAHILAEALERGKRARLGILSAMESAIAAPRASVLSSAPEIVAVAIDRENIGSLIGPGGKTIRRIREETGAEDIQVEEDGTVHVTGRGGSAERGAEAVRAFARREERFPKRHG